MVAHVEINDLAFPGGLPIDTTSHKITTSSSSNYVVRIRGSFKAGQLKPGGIIHVGAKALCCRLVVDGFGAPDPDFDINARTEPIDD